MSVVSDKLAHSAKVVRSVLKERIITALVLLAIILPAMFFGPPELWGAISLFAVCMAIFEWVRLLSKPSQDFRKSPSAAVPVAALAAGVGVAWMLLVQAFPGQTLAGLLKILCASAVAIWLVLGTLALIKVKPMPGGILVAFLLPFICWLALLELRRAGIAVLISAMAIVWVADIGAYFCGRAFGKRKLAPRISPGKSWEGAIGGAFFVVIIALFCAAAPALNGTLVARLVGHWSGFIAAVCLLGMVALSVMGDLHESLLKRAAGVKDSGATLPGHGGFLDRVDALIPTMPLAYLLWVYSV